MYLCTYACIYIIHACNNTGRNGDKTKRNETRRDETRRSEAKDSSRGMDASMARHGTHARCLWFARGAWPSSGRGCVALRCSVETGGRIPYVHTYIHTWHRLAFLHVESDMGVGLVITGLVCRVR